MYNLMRLVAFAALFLGSASSYAFDFTHAQTVSVPTGYVGEVWARAATEPWQKERSTVRGQCAKVLYSYNKVVNEQSISACEREVSTVNGRTPESLARLLLGEKIIVPLTRQEVLARKSSSEVHVTTPKLVTVDPSLATLRQEYNSLRDELRKTIAAQGDELSKLKATVAALPNTPAELATLKNQVAGVVETLARQRNVDTEVQLLKARIEQLNKALQEKSDVVSEVSTRLAKVESRLTNAPLSIVPPTTTVQKSDSLFSKLPSGIGWILITLVVVILIVAIMRLFRRPVIDYD